MSNLVATSNPTTFDLPPPPTSQYWGTKTSKPSPFVANPHTFLSPPHKLLGWVLSMNLTLLVPICTQLKCGGLRKCSKHKGSSNTSRQRLGDGNAPCQVFIAPRLVLSSHTHPKLYNFKSLFNVDTSGAVTKGCGNPATPPPTLVSTFPKLLNSICNVEGEDLGNVAKVVKTLVVTSTSNDVIKGCNKLVVSPKGRASSELQNSKPFDNGGSPNKVIKISKGDKTHKAWH